MAELNDPTQPDLKGMSAKEMIQETERIWERIRQKMKEWSKDQEFIYPWDEDYHQHHEE